MISFKFADEDLQERFIEKWGLYSRDLFGEVIEPSEPISWIAAKSVVSGKYGETLKKAINNQIDVRINQQRFESGRRPDKSKPVSTRNPEDNFNSFTLSHEQKIYDFIETKGGNITTLLNEITLLVNSLEKNNYSYNIVYYTDFNPRGAG